MSQSEYGGTSISDLIGNKDVSQKKTVYSESEYDSLFNDSENQDMPIEDDIDQAEQSSGPRPTPTSNRFSGGFPDGDFAPAGQGDQFDAIGAIGESTGGGGGPIPPRGSHATQPHMAQPHMAQPHMAQPHMALPTNNEARQRNNKRYVTITNQRMEDDNQIQRLIDPQTKDLANRINSKLGKSNQGDQFSGLSLPDLVETDLETDLENDLENDLEIDLEIDDDFEGEKETRTTPMSSPMTSEAPTALPPSGAPNVGVGDLYSNYQELNAELEAELETELAAESDTNSNDDLGAKCDSRSKNQLGGLRRAMIMIKQNRQAIGGVVAAIFFMVFSTVRRRRLAAASGAAASGAAASGAATSGAATSGAATSGAEISATDAPAIVTRSKIGNRVRNALSTKRSGLLTLLLISLFCGVIYVVVRYAIK